MQSAQNKVPSYKFILRVCHPFNGILQTVIFSLSLLYPNFIEQKHSPPLNRNSNKEEGNSSTFSSLNLVILSHIECSSNTCQDFTCACTPAQNSIYHCVLMYWAFRFNNDHRQNASSVYDDSDSTTAHTT